MDCDENVTIEATTTTSSVVLKTSKQPKSIAIVMKSNIVKSTVPQKTQPALQGIKTYAADETESDNDDSNKEDSNKEEVGHEISIVKPNKPTTSLLLNPKVKPVAEASKLKLVKSKPAGVSNTSKKSTKKEKPARDANQA